MSTIFNFIFFGLIFACVTNAQSIQDWYDHFEYNTHLDDHDNFQIFWTPKQDTCTVEIGIAVQTNSYAAFGISETGSMVGADIIMGWITDDNEVVLQNRYSTAFAKPQLFADQSSGFTAIDGWKEEIDGVYTTYLHFEKETFPDFDDNNVAMKIGTTRVIYAWGNDTDVMNVTSEPEQHCFQCRGVQSMNLLQGEQETYEMPEDTQEYDVKVAEHQLSDEETTYYCTLQALPPSENTQHVIRIDPVIDPIENQGTVHHMLLYYCPANLINQTDIGKAWVCDDMEQNMAPFQCRGNTVFAAWAIGGSDFYMPQNVGVEMGGTEPDAIQYVLLEIHYDNPTKDPNIIDRSGLKLHYISELREHSAGVLQIAMGIHPFGQFLPPGIADATNIAYCFPECTLAGIEHEEIYAFASMLHMHTYGKRQVFRHIRDGTELRPLGVNQAYDFNYQQFETFDEQVVVKPGDSFISECRLDTTGADHMIYGGESTQEEMCMTFLYVYPKPKLSLCHSSYQPLDLYMFYLSAQQLGYYYNATEAIIDGFYDVTVPGALEFYNDFQIGNVDDMDVFDYFPLTNPQKRLQSLCTDIQLNPLLMFNFTKVTPMPETDYSEYDLNEYYVCDAGAEDKFDWNVWYVYFIGILVGVVLILLIGVGICKMKASKTIRNDSGYQNYGTSQEQEHQISMQDTHNV